MKSNALHIIQSPQNPNKSSRDLRELSRRNSKHDNQRLNSSIRAAHTKRNSSHYLYEGLFSPKSVQKDRDNIFCKQKNQLITKFTKLFRNSLCQILEEHKLSADHIIYEEESLNYSSFGSDNGTSPKEDQNKKMSIPIIEDINLTENYFYKIVHGLNAKNYNENLADRIY